MSKFIVTVNVIVNGWIEIDADSMEEAEKIAASGKIKMGNLMDAELDVDVLGILEVGG